MAAVCTEKKEIQYDRTQNSKVSFTILTNLCWEGNLDASLQDVVGGDLNRAGQLQVLHDEVKGNLREHLLDLMGLLKKGREQSNREMHFGMTT